MSLDAILFSIHVPSNGLSIYSFDIVPHKMRQITTYTICILVLVLFSWFPSVAQDLSKPNTDSIETSNKLVIFPLAFYLPETSLGFGGAGAYTYRWKNQSMQNNPSQIQFVVTYTLENQVLIYVPYKLYFGNNEYFVFGEIGYYKYFYRYFGQGAETKLEQEETYETDFPKIISNFTKQVLNNWFIGPSLYYERFSIKALDPNGELITGILGNEGGSVFGLGVRLIHDSRDHTFYPTKGFYGDAAILIHEEKLGSNYDYESIDINLSKYFQISSKQVLAAHMIYRQVSQGAPFYQLALHGGPRAARGYLRGRFRDRSMMTINAEWRQKIKGRIGVVLFANYGNVAPRISSLTTTKGKLAGGFGVRYEIDKINQLNVRLDYGIGQDGGQFYITVGEAF